MVNNDKREKKAGGISPNLEVRQGVGEGENLEKKAAGHNHVSFAKMANLLEYCTLREFAGSWPFLVNRR